MEVAQFGGFGEVGGFFSKEDLVFVYLFIKSLFFFYFFFFFSSRVIWVLAPYHCRCGF